MNYSETMADVQAAVIIWFKSKHFTPNTVLDFPTKTLPLQEFLDFYNGAMNQSKDTINLSTLPHTVLKNLQEQGFSRKSLLVAWGLS